MEIGSTRAGSLRDPVGSRITNQNKKEAAIAKIQTVHSNTGGPEVLIDLCKYLYIIIISFLFFMLRFLGFDFCAVQDGEPCGFLVGSNREYGIQGRIWVLCLFVASIPNGTDDNDTGVVSTVCWSSFP